MGRAGGAVGREVLGNALSNTVSEHSPFDSLGDGFLSDKLSTKFVMAEMRLTTEVTASRLAANCDVFMGSPKAFSVGRHAASRQISEPNNPADTLT